MKDLAGDHVNIPPGTARRALAFVAHDKWPVIGAILIELLSTALGVLSPVLFGRFVDLIVSEAPAFERLRVLAFAAGSLFFSTVLQSTSQLLAIWLGQSQVLRLRTIMARHLENASFEKILKADPHSLSSKMTAEIAATQSLVPTAVQTLVGAAGTTVFALIVVGRTSLLALGGVVLTFPLVAFVAVFYARRLRRAVDRALESNKFVHQVARELSEDNSVLNVRSVIDAESFADRTDRLLNGSRHAVVGAGRVQASYSMATGLLAGSLTVIAYAVGGHQAALGEVTIGEMTAIVGIVPGLFASLQLLAGVNAELAEPLSAYSRVFETLDWLGESPAELMQTCPDRLNGSASRSRSNGVAVSMTDLLVGIDEWTSPPICGRLRPGRIVAVAGGSGSGKTSLLYTILGHVPPKGGKLELACPVDSRPGRAVTLVTQHHFFFPGTLRDNLLMANPRATDDQIWACLDAVGMVEVVRETKAGLETEMAQGALRFSGGQQARLSLARAFLTNPQILLVDEPTAHLDEYSRQKVVRSLESWARNNLTIVVTHDSALLKVAGTTLDLEGNRSDVVSS